MRASSSGMSTWTSLPSRWRSASSAPTWSPWPWVSAMRRIGAPAVSAAAMSAPAAPPVVGVDEREAVVLAHEEGVDEAEAGELGQVRRDGDGLHRGSCA